MMAPEVHSYQFDDVVIDLRAGRVFKAGQPLPLEPKAYDLLVLLASRSGELVSKQEVLDRVWAGVYVTDNAVARVVAQIRRALGDAARGARYIETVPTRGYRFIGPVSRHVAAAAESAVPETDDVPVFGPPGSGPGRPPGEGGVAEAAPVRTASGSPLWAAVFALVALAALVMAWQASDQAQPAAALLRTQVTSSSALDVFPAWSPDGTTLAYASDRSGRFEIYLRDMVAGGERTQLTADGQHNLQPAWSPDGRRLAYHSSGLGGIWIVDRAGGAPRQVSRFGSRPTWAPDGTRLAFQAAPYTEPGAAAFETFGPSSIWIVDVAGGQPRRVTDAWRPEGSHTRPTWFPDSQRLLFATQDLDATQFWTIDLRSGTLTRVLDAGARALDPALSPDGRAFYYVRKDDHFDLWRQPLTPDGTADGPPSLVVPPSELDLRHVAIHPDGTQLAYAAMATVGGLRSLPLHRDGVPSGPSVRIAEESVRSARRPSFSPDARRVAFERQSAGLPPAVWILDLASGAAHGLVQRDDGAQDPSWTRDGREVLFESGRGETRVLHAVDVASGATRVVARLGTSEFERRRPRLSPDGTRVAYTRSQEGQLEVWVGGLDGADDARVARLGDGTAFPVWSPDGTALAVDVWRDGHAEVHVVDLATGTSRQVSSGVEQAWVRSWSPDGTALAFAAAREGRWNVWTVRRDGTSQRQLTNYGDEHHYVRNPEWSPTGDRLVYEFASFAGNIWVVLVP